LGIATTLALAVGNSAHAQISDGVIKIGVLNDQSSLYADIAGQGATIAERLAVKGVGAAKKGMKVEVIQAAHQNKPEVGSAIARDTEEVVVKNGGKVVGKVRHPLNAQDFSSFLLQAQSSKAQIIGLANAGGDTINSIKQAAEFGIVKGGQNLAGPLVFISDVHALGLPTAQGLILTETFYWDHNTQTLAFVKRFAPQYKGNMPTMVQAGIY